MIDIRGLVRSDVLAALYNASRPQGLGFMQYDPAPMLPVEAARLLAEFTYFDYVKGRVLKINLKDAESFEERLYDRDNGEGAAQRVIDALRKTGSTHNADTDKLHQQGIRDAAVLAEQEMGHGVEIQRDGDINTVRLGLADAEPKLRPAIERAVNRPT